MILSLATMLAYAAAAIVGFSVFAIIIAAVLNAVLDWIGAVPVDEAGDELTNGDCYPASLIGQPLSFRATNHPTAFIRGRE